MKFLEEVRKKYPHEQEKYIKHYERIQKKDRERREKEEEYKNKNPKNEEYEKRLINELKYHHKQILSLYCEECFYYSQVNTQLRIIR